MRRLVALLTGGVCAGALIAGPTALATTEPPTEEMPPVPEAPLPGELTIMAPADPGGGWDGTARSMQTVLDPLIDGSVEVTNVPGAGGTIGLAEFANSAGSGTDLMVMGSVMIGAIMTNEAPVTLDAVTPIAALTTEYLAVVVPADSELETFEDLVAAFQEDPRSVSWAGGSAGGSDHQLVALIASAVGVEAGDVNYVAHSGGGEALASLLSGATTAGVSGVSEFAEQVAAGELRMLAVSAPEPLEGVDAPTIVETGVDVALPNWRGVVAPADLSEDDRASLLYAIDQMVRSDEWEAELERNQWTSFYISGDAFTEFIAEQRTQTEEVLTEIGLIS